MMTDCGLRIAGCEVQKFIGFIEFVGLIGSKKEGKRLKFHGTEGLEAGKPECLKAKGINGV
jgi:hypothetical protein